MSTVAFRTTVAIVPIMPCLTMLKNHMKWYLMILADRTESFPLETPLFYKLRLMDLSGEPDRAMLRITTSHKM